MVINLSCSLSYIGNDDLSNKLGSFQIIWNTEKDTGMKKDLYQILWETMGVLSLLYEYETWTIRNKDWCQLHAAGMSYLRSEK